MARTCTICSHPKLVNIDRQLLRGDMLNGIAHRFHVSPDAVGRHRRHMRTAMLQAQAAAETQDLVYGQTLIDEVKLIKADAERLQLEAEGRRDILELFSPDSALQPELPIPLIEGETDISATEELNDGN